MPDGKAALQMLPAQPLGLLASIQPLQRGDARIEPLLESGRAVRLAWVGGVEQGQGLIGSACGHEPLSHISGEARHRQCARIVVAILGQVSLGILQSVGDSEHCQAHRDLPGFVRGLPIPRGLQPLTQMGQPHRAQCLLEMFDQVVELAVAVVNQRPIHLIRKGFRVSLLSSRHATQIGGDLMEQRHHMPIAVVTALQHRFHQLEERPEQIHRKGGLVFGDRPDDRPPLLVEILEQGIALASVQEAARAGDGRQAFAHLSGDLGRPPLFCQRQPKDPLGGGIPLAEGDQQLRQPCRPQGFKVLGIEGRFACHGLRTIPRRPVNPTPAAVPAPARPGLRPRPGWRGTRPPPPAAPCRRSWGWRGGRPGP